MFCSVLFVIRVHMAINSCTILIGAYHFEALRERFYCQQYAHE